MNNKVGFKHYKDHDGKNIKYYERIVIFYINNEGKEVSHNFSNKDSRDYLVTYNDKFESAVVKSKTGITNIHRITSVYFGNEIILDIIKSKLTCDRDITLPPPPPSPQDILLTMEFEKQKRWMEKEEEIKKIKRDREMEQERLDKVNYKGLDNIVKLLKGINEDNKNFVNSLDNKKTMKYPLIYKLKEREDYKTMKEKFDEDIKQDVDYVLLVYNHEEDRFYREFYQTEEKNITILDMYKKK